MNDGLSSFIEPLCELIGGKELALRELNEKDLDCLALVFFIKIFI
jgi:hypothetical protein